MPFNCTHRLHHLRGKLDAMLPSHHVTSQVIAVCSYVATCQSIYLWLSFNDITVRFYLIRHLSLSLSLFLSLSLYRPLPLYPYLSLSFSIYSISIFRFVYLTLSVYMIFMTIILAIFLYSRLRIFHTFHFAGRERRKEARGIKFPLLFDASVFFVIPVNIVKWLFPPTHL